MVLTLYPKESAIICPPRPWFPVPGQVSKTELNSYKSTLTLFPSVMHQILAIVIRDGWSTVEVPAGVQLDNVATLIS
jgi:hypothetical protein